MTTVVRAFVDTNVLLRAIQTTLPLHFEADALIASARQQGYELWVSRQVIREYVVQVTRPGFLASPYKAKQVTAKVKVIRATFQVADDMDAVTDRLLELIEEYPTGGKKIHDANIVATMLAFNIHTLLTQNVEDMKRFSSKIALMPLEKRKI